MNTTNIKQQASNSERSENTQLPTPNTQQPTSLITITTCNRISEVQKYIWDYLNFVNQNNDFHFVLALDGKEQSYLNFCDEFNIPLIYSEEREGVGLSKNRVLEHFPNYDYYFFIDDDIELVNSDIFRFLIALHSSTGFHHFCNGHFWNKVKVEKHNGLNILFSMTGGGTFTFYSKEGIKKVGGFHTVFAKYKRFGHTEHTYRFYHAGLQNAPFIFPIRITQFFFIHSPESVTPHQNFTTNKNELIDDEQALINQKITYFPLQTLSTYHFNNKTLGKNEKVIKFLRQHPHRYPYNKRKERRKALAEYYAIHINKKRNSFLKNLTLALKSFFYSPMNNSLKHKVKFYLNKNN